MKERPILFSAPMVRAILDDRKTQTRRIINRVNGIGLVTEFQRSDTPGYDWSMRDKYMRWHEFTNAELLERCPYGKPGDRLWVRETFQPLFADGVENNSETNWRTGVGYKISYPTTDGIQEFVDADDNISDACMPSIHMPRWASRILPEITGVRVERLQDISEKDAIAEGISKVPFRPDDGWPICDGYMVGKDDGVTKLQASAYKAYKKLWESINGTESWDLNPWVWVVEFKVLEIKQ